MGFWIFMLVMVLLMPLLVVGLGTLLVKSPPKNVNWAFGYRTERSVKNKDTWAFAQRYSGRIWQRMGWPLLAVSVLIMLLVLGKDEDAVGTAGIIVVALQVAAVVGSLFPTERALKRTFDENGNRREGA